MATEVVKVTLQNEFMEGVRRATDVLMGGGLVAFPTETVYGLAARADDRQAIERLRSVKGRSGEKAFTVHVGSRSDAARFVPVLSGLGQRLIRKAWPGPLTVIFEVEDPTAAPIMAGLDDAACAAMYYEGSIGLRCPDDRVAEALLRAVPAPVVASSANLAGRAPPQTGADVVQELDGQIDLLLDAGRTRYSKPSTIVRVTGGRYKLVREGVYDAKGVKRLATLRLLFVCTGNTCRSPMAAGIAGKLIAERLGCTMNHLASRGVQIDSAGTSGGSGRAAENAVATMARRGIDISTHTSTALSTEQLVQADFTFAMTRGHRETILALLPEVQERARMLLDDEDIADPIGGDEKEYEHCAGVIERGVRARLEEIMP